MKPFARLTACVLMVCVVTQASLAQEPTAPLRSIRSRPVRVEGHSLVDDRGPFLGLGASYFTALVRAKHDRPRLESDLAFLSRSGFNYIRVFSMLGQNASWKG